MKHYNRALPSYRRAVVLAFLGATTSWSCGGATTGAAGTGGSSASGGSGSGGNMLSSGGVSGATGGTTSSSGGAIGATGGNASAMGGATTATGGGTSASGGGAGTAAAAGGASARGGAGGGTTATGGGNGGGGGGAVVGITKDSEIKITSAGLTLISYGGYLNGESFQEEGVLSYNGYQYTAFWNTARHVVLGRRVLPAGAWTTIELTDYTNTESDAHNTISLGICPGDGTLHLSFDHHVSPLHYRMSVAGLVTAPATASWAPSSFGAVTGSLVRGTNVSNVTYPRFITEPGGMKMLMELRIGSSGSGDEYLWEYDSATHAWTSLGKFMDGMTDNINGYPHGISYGKGGARLHISWCWRDTSDAATNHDLLYAYSDDNGLTWKNNAGAMVAKTGSSFLTLNSAGIKVWTIGQNRGLINQEHMAVDSAGRVHVLLSHMPDAQANDATFDSARTKSQYFHYWRNPSGTWTRTAMGVNAVASFRGKLAISSTNNLYAALPDLNLAAASSTTNFATWSVLSAADAGRFFSDPLIDSSRLLTEDKLTIVYPQKGAANIYVLDYTIK